jgi:hypothetical protein
VAVAVTVVAKTTGGEITTGTTAEAEETRAVAEEAVLDEEVQAKLEEVGAPKREPWPIL